MKKIKDNERVQLHLPVELMKDLRFLHKREGPINFHTNKRKPFSVYISEILGAHARERMKHIKALESDDGNWEDFE